MIPDVFWNRVRINWQSSAWDVLEVARLLGPFAIRPRLGTGHSAPGTNPAAALPTCVKVSIKWHLKWHLIKNTTHLKNNNKYVTKTQHLKIYIYICDKKLYIYVCDKFWFNIFQKNPKRLQILKNNCQRLLTITCQGPWLIWRQQQQAPGAECPVPRRGRIAKGPNSAHPVLDYRCADVSIGIVIIEEFYFTPSKWFLLILSRIY